MRPKEFLLFCTDLIAVDEIEFLALLIHIYACFSDVVLEWRMGNLPCHTDKGWTFRAWRVSCLSGIGADKMIRNK
jgi:hypothetical protein